MISQLVARAGFDFRSRCTSCLVTAAVAEKGFHEVLLNVVLLRGGVVVDFL